MSQYNDILQLYLTFGISLFVGVLIGLERQSVRGGHEATFAGIRTFPIISLLGALSAYISLHYYKPIFPIMLVLIALFVLASYIPQAISKAGSAGITTEMAALAVFILGALPFYGEKGIAVTVTILIFVLLTTKDQLHSLARKVEMEDFYAVAKFATITFIILPVLPNRNIGPYNSFNPYEIWLFVVLIAAISFIGYVSVKTVGSKRGLGLTGLLGGFASSTAVTLSISRRSKEASELSKSAALAIILACSTMFPRVILIIGFINKVLLKHIYLPLLIMGISGFIICGFLYFKIGRTKSLEKVNLKNPFELSIAIKFGILYAIINFVSIFANKYFSNRGLYISSALGGLTDVDAVVLSITRLIKNEGLEIKIATITIILATIVNTILKAVLTIILGTKTLSKYVSISLGIIAFIGIITMIFLSLF